MITKEQIDGILAFDGGGLPVMSLYLGLNPGDHGGLTTRVKSLLQQAHPLLEDRSFAREPRLSLRGDIQRIEDVANRYRGESGTVVWFSCSAAGLFSEVTLPRAVRDRIVLDVTPWVRPMLAVLDEFHRSCVVVIDKRETSVWALYQNELHKVDELKGRTLRKRDYAGWAGLEEHRVHNKADTLMRGHFRHTATLLDRLFRSEGYELLIIGGHEEEVPLFEEFLPKHLRPKLAGAFAVNTGSATRAEVQSKAQEIIDRYERAEGRQQVAEVFEKAAMGGLAAIGPEQCLWAGSVTAVQHLLVQDGALMPGVVCDESRWLALAGETCLLCGRAMRRTPDVLDELTETVIEEGGSVEHVQAGTELREHVVAASLRFPLPPQPEPTA
jgi:peptide chain release factor subunit 1